MAVYSDSRAGFSQETAAKSEALKTLRTFFGYDQFRPGQDRLIGAILTGHDTLGILPTGGGKSLCYQIPAMIFPGLTLVISPLISLMNDQVAALIARGIPAAMISSEYSRSEQQKVLRRASSGSLKLLYVSPERLLSPSFRDFARTADISFLCVDEAHCISEWGKEFRPSYLRIRDFLDYIRDRGQDPVVAAFTATATPDVRSDIMDLLALRNPFCLTSGFDRKNLYYEVRKPRDKWADLLSLLHRYRGFCGIIYCLTRSAVDALTRRLASEHLPAVRYHAGLSDAERRISQERWLRGDVKIIVATNAFGMGIDKPDVRFVIHYNLPCNIENYYQEAGRAGRDGLPSDCILLFSDRDVKACRFFISRTASPKLRAHMKEELRSMREYAGSKTCLRSYLLRYFGEHAEPWCGKCSVCLETVPFPKRPPKGVMDPHLRRNLTAIRKDLAGKYGKLPYQIFSERTLDDLAAVRPESIPEFLGIEGAPLLHVLRYGEPFLEEIRTWSRT